MRAGPRSKTRRETSLMKFVHEERESRHLFLRKINIKKVRRLIRDHMKLYDTPLHQPQKKIKQTMLRAWTLHRARVHIAPVLLLAVPRLNV